MHYVNFSGPVERIASGYLPWRDAGTAIALAGIMSVRALLLRVLVLAGVGAAGGGCGCASTPAPAPLEASRGREEPASTTAISSGTSVAESPSSRTNSSTRRLSGPPSGSGENPRLTPAACRLTVSETEGCPPSDVEVLVAPARARIEACRSSSGGKLRVRVRNVAGKLAFEVEPGSSLNPTERKCVLEALTTLREDGASSLSTGATVRPTGFTSLITIEW